MSNEYSQKKTVRKSVALPYSVVQEAMSVAEPRPELGANFNQVVTTALREFAERHRAEQFAQDMAAMAADPAIQAENKGISGEFAGTEMDGLKDEKS